MEGARIDAVMSSWVGSVAMTVDDDDGGFFFADCCIAILSSISSR